MRVLQIINSLEAGGAERLVADLVPALAARGVESGILSLSPGDGAFGASLRARGFPVHTGTPGSLYRPGRVGVVARTIRAFPPDIVHVHLAPAFHWSAIALVVNRCRIPAVVTEHTTNTRRMSRFWLRPVERLLYRRYGPIICAGRAIADAVGPWIGGTVHRLAVIENGIDPGRLGFTGTGMGAGAGTVAGPVGDMEARPVGDPGAGITPAPDILGFLRGRIGVVMVARFTEAKDHATVVRALASLPGNFALVFAGDGGTLSGIVRLTESLGAGSRVLFAGTRNDIPAVLAACRVAVLASHWEGMGLALVEAMAAGLPVVASDIPGLREVVAGAGTLVPAGDAASMATAIAEAAGEGPLRETLVRRGRERVLRYSIGRCADEHVALYADLLEAAPGRSGSRLH